MHKMLYFSGLFKYPNKLNMLISGCISTAKMIQMTFSVGWLVIYC